MDKETFVKIAPDYYATAIIVYLDRYGQPVSGEELSNEYSISEDDGSGYKSRYLARHDVFDAALQILGEMSLVDVVVDPFGLPIISPVNDLYTKLIGLAKDASFPFYKYKLTRDGDRWLREALQSLDRTYDTLGVTAADFDNPP